MKSFKAMYPLTASRRFIGFRLLYSCGFPFVLRATQSIAGLRDDDILNGEEFTISRYDCSIPLPNSLINHVSHHFRSVLAFSRMPDESSLSVVRGPDNPFKSCSNTAPPSFSSFKNSFQTFYLWHSVRCSPRSLLATLRSGREGNLYWWFLE